MTAQSCRQLIERWLDDTLSDSQKLELAREVEAQLPHFPELQREWQAAKLTRQSLEDARDFAAPAPAFLRANVRAALVAEAEKKQKAPFWLQFSRPLWAGGAFAALALLFVARDFIGEKPLSAPMQSERPTLEIQKEPPTPAPRIPQKSSSSAVEKKPVVPKKRAATLSSTSKLNTESRRDSLPGVTRKTEDPSTGVRQPTRVERAPQQDAKPPSRAVAPAPNIVKVAPMLSKPSRGVSPPARARNLGSAPNVPAASSVPSLNARLKSKQRAQNSISGEVSGLPHREDLSRPDAEVTAGTAAADSAPAPTVIIPPSLAPPLERAPMANMANEANPAASTVNGSTQSLATNNLTLSTELFSLRAQNLPDMKALASSRSQTLARSSRELGESERARDAVKNQETAKTGRLVRPESPTANAPTRLVRLRIQATLEISNVRFLIEQKELWRGDLSAKKPLEINVEVANDATEVELKLEKTTLPAEAKARQNPALAAPLSVILRAKIEE